MKYNIVGLDDVIKMRTTTKSLKCISQTGRLLLIPSKDLVSLLNSDFVLKTRINQLISQLDIEN